MAINAHAYLITHGTKKRRQEEALRLAQLPSLTPKPDVFILGTKDHQPIGIDDIRKLTHEFSLKPHQEKIKKSLILEAQTMTVPAQNALLKTLEEPPGQSLIILTATHPQNLLPTVISRCRRIHLTPLPQPKQQKKEYLEAQKTLLGLLSRGRGERLDWSEKNKKRVSGRTESQKILSHWIMTLRELILTKEKNRKNTLLKESLEYGLKLLETLQTTRVSPRLVLEHFLLTAPHLEPEA